MQKFFYSDYWMGFVSATFGALMSFVTPVWPFIFLVIVLTSIDLYSGVKAARKRGEKIHSKGLRRSIEKITLYVLSILAAEQMRLTFFPSLNITYVVSFGICITELQSLVENVETVTGVNIWSRIKAILPDLHTPKK